MSRIGLIAGNGRFPFLALQGARSLGHDVTVVAIKEEAFPDLEGSAREAKADFHWVSLGQLGKCIKVLKSAGVSQAVMAGQVKHVKIFSGIMLRRCDAALLIGDPALFLDHERLGAEKIDLGEQWKSLTGLPFVWAFWAGRREALSPAAVSALIAARDSGVARSDEVAAAYCGPERAARGQSYLRENIQYTLGERAEAGLMKYYELAERTGVVNSLVPPMFY